MLRAPLYWKLPILQTSAAPETVRIRNSRPPTLLNSRLLQRTNAWMLEKMKTVPTRLFSALFFCTCATFSRAGDFQSVIFDGSGSNPLPTIHVGDDHILVIRNFTQVGGSTRGVVNATLLVSGNNADVLTAAFVDPASSSPDVINELIIAGPANISATCPSDATSCFITYRKAED